MRNDTFFVTMVVLTAVIIVTGFNLLIQDTMYANATIAPAGIPAVHQNIGIVPGEFTTLMDSIFGAIGGPRPAPSIGNIPGGVPGIPNIQNEPPVIPSFPGNIFGSGSGAHNNHGSPSSGVPGNIFGP